MLKDIEIQVAVSFPAGEMDISGRDGRPKID